MAAKDHNPRELLHRLKDDLEKTLEAHRAIVDLRSKKLEQDREQFGTYFKILESENEGIKLNPKNTKKIDKVLSWKSKYDHKLQSHSIQQEALEDHLLELQKILVNLLSKRFKY